MRYGKYILFISLLFLSIYLLIPSYEETVYDETVTVEIRGEVTEEKTLQVEKGTSFEEILPLLNLTEEADISSIPLQMILSNHQVIVIPEKKKESLISLNSGTLEEFMSLPGIGEVIACRIIEYREKHGSFQSVEEIVSVSGIGEKKYEAIRPFITL